MATICYKQKMIKLFVFDFDGTLSDSAQFICDTMKQAFNSHDKSPPSDHVVRQIIGLQLEQAIRVIDQELSQADVVKIAKNYRDIYRTQRQKGALTDSLFSGAQDVLELINVQDHLAGIATGKSRRGLEGDIERYQIAHYFIGYETSDHHPSKPHPAMLQSMIQQSGLNETDTIMIGDTTYDMQMAKSAGALAIGVSWGCHTVDQLKQAGADYIVTDFSQLNDFIL